MIPKSGYRFSDRIMRHYKGLGRNRVTINHIPLKIGITQRVPHRVPHLEASKQSRLCVRLH
jgi:hypothetical protein